MPQPENNERFQRHCTNCGAALRAGTGFCVSCGVPVGVPSGQGSEHPRRAYSEPRSSTAIGSLSNSLQEKLEGLGQWFSGSRSILGTRDMRRILGRAVNWFRNVPSVPKLVIVALVLLALLVVLSPLVQVVCIIAFLVSVAILILHGVRRRFVPRWGIVTLASLILIPVFGGISGALYGTADYRITDKEGGTAPNGAKISHLFVQTETTAVEDFREIASEISDDEAYNDFLWLEFHDESIDNVTAMVVDINSETGANFVGNPDFTVEGGQKDDGVYVLTGADVEGYAGAGESGIEPVSPEPSASTSPEASDETPTDEDNAEILLTTLQAGMVDGDQAIKDVEVTGSKATVIVSGVSDAYAESTCRFVLGAAPELMMESESNDYAGITEVSVKRPLRLWNAASC